MVSIKPGKPVFAGMMGNRFLLGLPGNPVSCMVTFELFVRPLLDRLLGKKELGARRGRACIIEGARFKPGRRKFLRGRAHEMDGRVLVRLHTDQESGVLRSMVESDVLVDVAEGVERLHAGSLVDILYLE